MSNKVSTSLLPAIEQEIIANYEIKEWKKFNYITVEPPASSYVWLALLMLVVQAVWWFFVKTNLVDKINGGLF